MPFDALCIGECMIEFSDSGKAIGGDTFNTAVAMQKAGKKVSYLTCFGNDENKDFLLSSMSSTGVDLSLCPTVNAKNGSYSIETDSNGERRFAYDRKNSAATQLSTSLLSNELIQSSELIYSSGITQAISSSAKEFVQLSFQKAKELGVKTAFDINYRANLISAEEASKNLKALAPYIDWLFASEDDIPILEDTNIEFKNLVLKKGEAGAFYQDKKIPAFPTKALDTTGAGDVFNGFFLATENFQIASAAAALQVTKPGAISAIPTLEEVTSLIDRENT